MKRVISLILCALTAVCIFASCSKSDNEKTTSNTTKVQSTELGTEDAKISGSAAIELLKSYDVKDLELQDVKKEYQFMLATVGEKVKGEKYVRAEAGAMVESGKDDSGNTTYEMKSYKTYYISFDGTKILVVEGKDKYKTINIDSKKLAKYATTTTKSETTKK